MTRSQWQANEYMKTAKQTQADVERAEMWKRLNDRKARNAKIKGRLTTWFVIVCLAIVVKMLWNAAAA